MLETLHLSGAQAERLLPHLERACRLFVEHYAASSRRLSEARAAYTAYRDQKRRNVGIDPAVEERASAAHLANKLADVQVDAELLEIEGVILNDIFTRRQRELADGYHVDRAALMAATGSRPGRGGTADRTSSAPAGPGGRAVPHQSVHERLMAEIREELDAIHEFQRPTPGAVARHLLTPAAAILVFDTLRVRKPPIVVTAQRVATAGTRDYPRERYEAEVEAVLALKHEIQGWNLINGLHLEPWQVYRLIDVVERARHVEAQRQSARLEVGARPSGTDDVRFNQAARALEDAAARVLTPGQHRVLDEFVVCFKGKPSLRDPVRVGQADVSIRMETWLAHARRLDAAGLEKSIAHLVASEEKRLLGPLSDRERSDRVAALRHAARQAAAMTDVDFALDGPALAERITPPNRPADLSDRLHDVHRAAGQTGKLARFMFRPTFLHALQTRARDIASRSARTVESADVPRAEQSGRGCAQPPAGEPCRDSDQ